MPDKTEKTLKAHEKQLKAQQAEIKKLSDGRTDLINKINKIHTDSWKHFKEQDRKHDAVIKRFADRLKKLEMKVAQIENSANYIHEQFKRYIDTEHRQQNDQSKSIERKFKNFDKYLDGRLTRIEKKVMAM